MLEDSLKNPDLNLKSIDRADDSKQVLPYHMTRKTLLLGKFGFVLHSTKGILTSLSDTS